MSSSYTAEPPAGETEGSRNNTPADTCCRHSTVWKCTPEPSRPLSEAIRPIRGGRSFEDLFDAPLSGGGWF